MKLTNMEISGFKLYEETHSFTFGMANQIIGDRGKGKTALCEAIVWCLKGCDLQGSTRGLKKRLKNWATKEIRVVTQWDFLQTNGSIACHQFSRVSKGRSTHLYLDGVVVEQLDFDRLIGPTDTLLSIFYPGYFGGLAAVKTRSVILSMLPTQELTSVLESLTEEDQNRLIKYDMTDPLRFMQELKNDLMLWNEYIRDVEKRIGMFRMAHALNNDNDLHEEDQQLKDLKCELETLSQSEGPQLPDYLSDWEKERIALGNQYHELVTSWKVLNNKPMLQVNQQVEKCERQAKLDEITRQCQVLLDRGFAIKQRIASERKHYDEDQADFLARKDVEMHQLRIAISLIENKQAVRRNNGKLAEGLPRMQLQFNEGIEERITCWLIFSPYLPLCFGMPICRWKQQIAS